MFGMNAASVRRGVLSGSVLQGLSISVPMGVPIFGAIALIFGVLGRVMEFSTATIMWLSLSGITHFVWGRYWNYRAVRAMGANLVGPVQQLSIILSLGLAIGVLDEVLTPLRIFGIVLVIGGPIAMLRGRAGAEKAKASDAPAKAAFTPKYAEGYLCAVLSSTGYGTSSVLVRLALADTDPAAGLPGVFVAYLAATLVVGAALLRPGQLRHVLSMQVSTMGWFSLSGLLVGVSHMFRYMALTIIPVTVAAPLQQTQAIFRLLFAWLFNREHEVFGFWVLAGIALSLIGALALSLSTDFVLQLVAWPDWLMEVARWEWP